MDLHLSRDFPEDKLRFCPGCLRAQPAMLCKCLDCNGHMLMEPPPGYVPRACGWSAAKATWE
eukprot:7747866-Lingulodinium_polyedra.AAC.1